jgi:RNA 3'-terminal phosphate cyclase (GTP)
VKWSQPFDYFQNVFLPHLTKYADIETNLVKRGYYPKGGGNVKVTIEGKGEPEQPIQLLSQGDLLQIKGVSHASRDLQDSRVAERQAKSCELALSNLDCPVTIRREYAQTRSTGSGITVRAIYGGSDGVDMNNPVALGADALGEPSKKAEDVGDDAANQLQKVVGTDAAADKYLADQLVPFLAVAGGALMTSEVTSHVLSNIYVAEAFLPVSFNIEQNTIRCTSRSD